jgi:hypothetical protein
MKKSACWALAVLLSGAVALPGLVRAEDSSDATLREDLDRNDAVADPSQNPSAAPTPVGTDDVDAARRAEDDLESHAKAAKVEVKSLDSEVKRLKYKAGSLTDSQKAALNDYEAARDAANQRIDEVDDADSETAAAAKSRIDAAMSTLKDAFDRFKATVE